MCRQHEPEAKRARLFQQGKEQFFARRVRRRRQIAEDLVHVEDGPKTGRTLLCAHPADDFGEQHCYEEHALVVAEVGNRQHRDAWLAVRGVEQALCAERLAFHPRGEAWRGEQIVEFHCQPESILRRVKRFKIHHAHPGHWRVLDGANEPGDVEIPACAPASIEDL